MLRNGRIGYHVRVPILSGRNVVTDIGDETTVQPFPLFELLDATRNVITVRSQSSHWTSPSVVFHWNGVCSQVVIATCSIKRIKFKCCAHPPPCICIIQAQTHLLRPIEILEVSQVEKRNFRPFQSAADGAFQWAAEGWRWCGSKARFHFWKQLQCHVGAFYCVSSSSVYFSPLGRRIPSPVRNSGDVWDDWPLFKESK